MFKNKITKSLLFLFISLSMSNSLTYNNPTQELKNELLSKINAGIPEWMIKQIAIDLADVPKSGITQQMIEETINQDLEFIAKFSIRNGQVSVHTKMARRDYCNPLHIVLNELSSYVKLPDVDILYNVDDAPYNYANLIANNVPPVSLSKYLAPVLSPTKHLNDKNVVAIPDTHTLMRMEPHFQAVQLGNSKYTWEIKRPKAFWRGATTGGFYYQETYNKFPRAKLVQLSSQFPEILDAKFNEITQDATGQIEGIFAGLDYLSNNINVSEHMQYKYQILIDGNASAWTRCYWQLHCNSVILKQDSDYIQWYHALLKPYVHYIPFDYYCSDLLEKIQWAKDNDNKVQEIIKNANDLAENCLKYSDMLLYLYVVITSYAKLQAFQP